MVAPQKFPRHQPSSRGEDLSGDPRWPWPWTSPRTPSWPWRCWRLASASPYGRGRSGGFLRDFAEHLGKTLGKTWENRETPGGISWISWWQFTSKHFWICPAKPGILRTKNACFKMYSVWSKGDILLVWIPQLGNQLRWILDHQSMFFLLPM